MASKKSACMFVVMCMVVLGAMVSEADISCGYIESQLYPCLIYLTGGPGPSVPCCDGVRTLSDAASTTPDRREACRCLKSLAAGVSSLILDNAATLPGKCGVSIPYNISPNIDCDSITV